jgi:DNA-cytosine methyltransferase
MSCGQIALDQLGIKVNKYYASEIDKYAIAVAKTNYPNTIHVGDITQLDPKDFKNIDLILAGSPCQGFSFAGKQLAFDDPRSALFFEFIRLLKAIKPKYFLLENVRMKQQYIDVITQQVSECYPEHEGNDLFDSKIEPILINSALLSAQSRQRLYWTNIPNVRQPEDLGIVLKDILEDDFDSERDKSYCIDANYYKGANVEQYQKKSRRQLVNKPKQIGKIDTHSVVISKIREKSKTVRSGGRASYDRHEWDSVDELHWRKLTPLECERLQTVPDNYTASVSNTQRYKMLGNGWTVGVIAHILTNMETK